MHEALTKRGIKLKSSERKQADKFYAQMQTSQWTINGEPVHDWVAALQGRLAKIRAGFKTEPSDWRQREGKMLTAGRGLPVCNAYGKSCWTGTTHCSVLIGMALRSSERSYTSEWKPSTPS